jgi:hypothetical protein
VIFEQFDTILFLLHLPSYIFETQQNKMLTSRVSSEKFFTFKMDQIQPGKRGASVHTEEWPLLLKVMPKLTRILINLMFVLLITLPSPQELLR